MKEGVQKGDSSEKAREEKKKQKRAGDAVFEARPFAYSLDR